MVPPIVIHNREEVRAEKHVGTYSSQAPANTFMCVCVLGGVWQAETLKTTLIKGSESTNER